jgi:hypothetical protein
MTGKGKNGHESVLTALKEMHPVQHRQVISKSESLLLAAVYRKRITEAIILGTDQQEDVVQMIFGLF